MPHGLPDTISIVLFILGLGIRSDDNRIGPSKVSDGRMSTCLFALPVGIALNEPRKETSPASSSSLDIQIASALSLECPPVMEAMFHDARLTEVELSRRVGGECE